MEGIDEQDFDALNNNVVPRCKVCGIEQTRALDGIGAKCRQLAKERLQRLARAPIRKMEEQEERDRKDLEYKRELAIFIEESTEAYKKRADEILTESEGVETMLVSAIKQAQKAVRPSPQSTGFIWKSRRGRPRGSGRGNSSNSGQPRAPPDPSQAFPNPFMAQSAETGRQQRQAAPSRPTPDFTAPNIIQILKNLGWTPPSQTTQTTQTTQQSGHRLGGQQSTTQPVFGTAPTSPMEDLTLDPMDSSPSRNSFEETPKDKSACPQCKTPDPKPIKWSKLSPCGHQMHNACWDGGKVCPECLGPVDNWVHFKDKRP